MAVTRVNSSSISGTSTAATAYTAAVGVAVAIGDLIVVNANSNGTHVTNGMACSDSKNGAYTTLLETDQGGASTRWQQTFWKVATVAMVTTDTISLTPYASNTASAFSVDIFRGTGGTISHAAVGTPGASGTTAANPALAAAPAAGDLVLTLATASSGTLTQPAAFTKGSFGTTNVATANAYVLSADGSSTYGGTWTLGTTNTSAEQTVAFAGSTVAAAPRHTPVVRQAVNRAAVV